jgi:hypothetical protein
MAATPNQSAGLSARVTESFRGVRDGEVYPVKLQVGSIIVGDLAVSAIGMGKAEVVSAGKPARGNERLPFSTGSGSPASSRHPVRAKTEQTSTLSGAKRKSSAARVGSQSKSKNNRSK